MKKKLLLAGLLSLTGASSALAETSALDNPLYKDFKGTSAEITADQDSADQYCILKGFSLSEDFEVKYKDSKSWTFDGEKWTLEETDSVLSSVECSGERSEVEPYPGRRYPGRRYPGRRYPGGGHGGYPGGGQPGGGYGQGCQGKITGKWYQSGERTSFPIRGKYFRCVNGKWRVLR